MGMIQEMSRKRVGYLAVIYCLAAFAAHAAEMPEVNPLAPKPAETNNKPLDPVLENVLKTVADPKAPAAVPPVDVPASPVAASAPMPDSVTDVNKELIYRSALGRADDIKLLLSKGANPNQINNDGVPLLLVASARKDSEALDAVQALLEGGAYVNIKDKDGQTALYYAVRSGQPKTIELLLRRGIDYYSLDNSGNIARTIAFRAGRQDIVDLMDNFVKGEAKKVESQYQQVNETAEEMKARAQAEAEAAAVAAVKKQETDARVAERKAKAEEARRVREYERNLESLDEKVRDISYHACAFQYWSFCQAMDQTTDLTEEEMNEAITMHRETVQDTSLEVMKMFDVGLDYVNQIINPSKQAIYDQLAAMPSRTFRKENGVGQLEDVTTRCERIARNWEVVPPKEGIMANATSAARRPNQQKNNQKKSDAPAKPASQAKPAAKAEPAVPPAAAAAARRLQQKRSPYVPGQAPVDNNVIRFKNGQPVGE